MPQFSWDEKPVANDNERADAEQRTLGRIEQAVRTIQLSLSELAHIPNPDSKFVNRVNQRALIDVLLHLCNCTNPPIKLGELESGQQPKATARICVNCGASAPFSYRG